MFQFISLPLTLSLDTTARSMGIYTYTWCRIDDVSLWAFPSSDWTFSAHSASSAFIILIAIFWTLSSMAVFFCSRQPWTGLNMPGVASLMLIRDEASYLYLLVMLCTIKPRIPLAFLAGRTHCWLMFSLLSKLVNLEDELKIGEKWSRLVDRGALWESWVKKFFEE